VARPVKGRYGRIEQRWLTRSGRFRSFPNRPRCKHWLPARGSSRWSFRLPRRLPQGRYDVYSRAISGEPEVEDGFTVRDRNLVRFRLR
jgi:hypothetical protein